MVNTRANQRDRHASRAATRSAEGLETALDPLAASRVLSRVTYAFASDDPAASWAVEQMEVSEAISAPYEAIVDLVSLAHDDPARLLGQPCTLTMRRDDAVRTVHGIVQKVAHGEKGSAYTATRVHVVPALALLGLRVDCRIFQDKTVPEILAEVLGDALGAHGRTHERQLRRADYPRRAYVVQHRESDLAFVERLMAEEGIWYYFAQGAEPLAGEVLTLLDANDDAPRARFGNDGERLPVDRAQAPIAHRQSASRFVRELALSATSVHVQAVDWTDPSEPREHAEPQEPGAFARYEPHGLTLFDYRDRRYLRSDARAQARMRLDAQPGRAPTARGAGNLVGLAPGQRLEVSLDPFQRDERHWIVTSVHARGRDAARTDRAVDGLDDYSCEFTCALATVPVRPPRKPKPKVYGAQTGRVVGPDGKPEVAPGSDDIHTDEHGRIQVRLDWDRSESSSSTCFLRTAQAWAGGGLGFHFVPRIGMEVIVSFVDGDPDRPLVTGCLYNGLNRAVYELPAHKTRSYIRTQSSPSGAGANEISFEDADGHELVALHAQRDHREVVRRTQRVTIGGDRKVEVGGHCTRSIVGDACDEVGGQRRVVVQRDDTLRVSGARSVDVAGNEITRVGAARRLEVMRGTTELFSGGRSVTVRGSEQLTVAGGAHKCDHVTGQYDIRADGHFRVEQGRTQLSMKDAFFLSADGDVQLENAGFHLHAQADGTTSITIERKLTLQVGRSRITMDASGEIVIDGPASATIRAQGGEFVATAKDARVGGQKVAVRGQALAEVTAALVKIN